MTLHPYHKAGSVSAALAINSHLDIPDPAMGPGLLRGNRTFDVLVYGRHIHLYAPLGPLGIAILDRNGNTLEVDRDSLRIGGRSLSLVEQYRGRASVTVDIGYGMPGPETQVTTPGDLYLDAQNNLVAGTSSHPAGNVRPLVYDEGLAALSELMSDRAMVLAVRKTGTVPVTEVPELVERMINAYR